jgi:hypothetical protein
LEVASATADESISVISSDSDDGISTGGGLLSIVEWKVLPLLDVLYDLRPQTSGNSRRGYTLIDGGTTVSRAVGEKSSNESFSLFSPSGSSVTVRVALILQPYFSRTTLSEKTSVLQLFTNIVGLAGIFSVFGVLFQQAEKVSVQKRVTSDGSLRRCISSLTRVRRGSSRKILSSAPDNINKETMSNDSSNTECRNPIYNQTTDSNAKTYEQPQQNQQLQYEISDIHVNHDIVLETSMKEEESQPHWLEYSDGQETWYISPTGEAHWQLPSGATSVRAVT